MAPFGKAVYLRIKNQLLLPYIRCAISSATFFSFSDDSFNFQRLKRYRCIEAINEAVAKKSYSTGNLIIYLRRFSAYKLPIYTVCTILLFPVASSVYIYVLLQIRLAFQNCIILFTSLKVQRSTLLLNLKLLMLNQRNKKGT